MPSNATILIADISGYTDFLTTTEIVHSTHIINELLDVLLTANADRFSLVEIEGDALLLYREGEIVSRVELTRHCVSLLTAFHSFLKVIERDRVCDCGACSTATGLDLKFIAHYGEVDHIAVGPIRKPAGVAMIVAHRLLKNSVPESSYVLASCTLLDSAESGRGRVFHGEATGWLASADEYAAVGTVPYEYLSLAAHRDSIPEAPRSDVLVTPVGGLVDVRISAPMSRVYGALIDHESKRHWVKGLDDVIVEGEVQRVGSRHVCKVGGAKLDFETAQAVLDAERRVLVERVSLRGRGIELYTYAELIAVSPSATLMRSGFAPIDGAELPSEILDGFLSRKEQELERFKQYCESLDA